MNEARLLIDIPEAYSPLLSSAARYLIFYGGRGKAASWSFARAALGLAARRRMRVLCTREFQNSIQESIYETLVQQLELTGISRLYRPVGRTSIESKLGSQFIFKGLRHNIKSIKSFEGIDLVLAEEAETISEESWRILIPTIRKSGSQLWVTFNPDQPTDPTYRRFVAKPHPDSVVRKVTWRDNPHFPEALRREMEYDRSVDPEAAAWVWDGEFRRHNEAGVLAGKWIVQDFVVPATADGPYQGADWGFGVDPNTLVRCWIADGNLLIEHEAYGHGVELDEIPSLWSKVPEAGSYVIRADNSRPETISHVRKLGFPRLVGAEKWDGSVEDGIAFIRSFKQVIIHSRCRYAQQEARLYSYKRDKLSKDVLPIIVDKHNHIWDAVRYALQPLIKISKKQGRPRVRSLIGEAA